MEKRNLNIPGNESKFVIGLNQFIQKLDKTEDKQEIIKIINDSCQMKASVDICDDKTNQTIETIMLSVALIKKQSEVLFKTYQYDGKLKIPKTIHDVISYNLVQLSGIDIFKFIVNADKFALSISPKLDYSSIKYENIFTYVEEYHCAGINTSVASVLKKMISIYFISLMTPHIINNPYLYTYIHKCENKSDDILSHNKCLAGTRYHKFAKLAEKIMQSIPYSEMLKIYLSCAFNKKKHIYHDDNYSEELNFKYENNSLCLPVVIEKRSIHSFMEL
jgi:hypothetical protein